MGYERALSLLRKGRANPSDYLVSFPSRVLRHSSSRDFGDYVSYFTRAVSLPATNNTTIGVVGHENIGIRRNVTTGRAYGSPVIMTFSERADMVIYSTIKGWIDSTVLNSAQGGGVAQGNSFTSNRNLRVQYYDNYKCDIEIYKLEPIQGQFSSVNIDEYEAGQRSASDGNFRGHTPTAKWTLINAMPLAIEQSTMSIEAADSLLDFTCSIAYESFRFDVIDTLPNGFGNDTLNNRN
jgi:hypothetical protein